MPNRTTPIGFGFDRCNNDFKVVRVWKTSNQELMYDIYSSRSDNWREGGVIDIEIHGIETRFGFFNNGSVHWIISKSDLEVKYSILKFDCVEDEFREIELPGIEMGKPIFAEYLGKLVLVVYEAWKEFVKMWAMEENGEWKELGVKYEGFMSSGKSRHNMVVVLVEDGDIIRLGDCDLDSSDLNTPNFYQPLMDRVFEETMFMMDAPNSKSYNKEEEMVYID